MRAFHPGIYLLHLQKASLARLRFYQAPLLSEEFWLLGCQFRGRSVFYIRRVYRVGSREVQ